MRMHMPMQAWCYSLRTIRDDIEKEHAFLGLCAMVTLSPSILSTSTTPAPPSVRLASGGCSPAAPERATPCAR